MTTQTAIRDTAIDADLVALVERNIGACSPRGVSPCYSEISAVRVVASDSKRRVVEADVTMFDGEPALLRLTEHLGFAGPMYSHRWFTDRPVFWHDGAWRRASEGESRWDTSPAAAA